MLPLTKILCPTDFSPAAREAVNEAVELALHFKAELLLVNVVPVLPPAPQDPNISFEVPEYERALHADADRQLGTLIDELQTKGVVTRAEVGHGDAGMEIVRIAKDHNAGLIVIATHGSTGWRHVMFGSVAEKVVRLAQRPVLVVPASRS